MGKPKKTTKIESAQVKTQECDINLVTVIEEVQEEQEKIIQRCEKLIKAQK